MRIALYHTPCLTVEEITSNGHLHSAILSSVDKRGCNRVFLHLSKP